MTTTNSNNFGESIERAPQLKVGNYKNSIFEAITEAKDYISRNDCKFLSIDISGLNLIDAMKVCILSSTYHFAKYNDGKIKWFVKDENTKKQIEMLNLDNIEISIKYMKKSYVDIDRNFVRKLRICK